MNNNKELIGSQMRLDYMMMELQKGLMNDLYWLLKESNNYDALINIGDSPNIKSFKAHKSILSARSLYFRALLSNNNSSGRNSFIEITQTNIRPDIFDAILKFIYTGTISLDNRKDVKVLFDYIIAAEKLWLYQLIQYVENYLIHQNNEWLKSNFIYVLITINSNPTSFKLLHEFVDEILRYQPNLLFDSEDFHLIPKNILIQLLQQRKFSRDVTEEKIWSIVLNWGINQNIDLIDKDIRYWTCSDFNKLQTTLQHCIPLIRFTDITPKTFYDNIDPYKKILTSGLYQKITQCPTFIAYNKLKLPSRTILPSKSLNIEQKRGSISSISSLILDAFPKPPCPISSTINEFILTSSISQSLTRSTSQSLTRSTSQSLTRSTSQSLTKSTVIPKNTERSTDSKTTSTTGKSKHTIKENKSIKKPDELLARLSNSVLSTWSSTYTVRGKQKSTVSIKTSENGLSLIKEKLKRSNSSSKKSESTTTTTTTTTSPEPVKDLEANRRKIKRRLNRKASIISYSKATTPMMSLAIIPGLS